MVLYSEKNDYLCRSTGRDGRAVCPAAGDGPHPTTPRNGETTLFKSHDFRRRKRRYRQVLSRRRPGTGQDGSGPEDEGDGPDDRAD